ncbi:uncharacterized protein LOC133784393 [Humulus lupulus]|uniref:uncharacterized protein LOC133784393 n=1 Tax=Humulus lupulus TaxID=3486 RepID=UPI002B40343A|nr:uncharacterized protein LOC133784393 [Humulus lupulus]
MSCFKLPVKLCQQIESLMAKFWWGSLDKESKIHWKKWSTLCSSKLFGGLGVQSLIHFNQAMLAKQAWRILQCQNSLLTRLLRAKYFANSGFLEAKKGHAPSYTWKSLLWGRDLLKMRLIWKIEMQVCSKGLSMATNSISKTSISNISWNPPPAGCLKLNIDATIDSKRNKIEFGVVVRNDKGKVLVSLTVPSPGNFTSSIAEGQTLLHALKWCLIVSLPISCVEVDSKVIVDNIMFSDEDLSPLSDIVREIRNSLSSFLRITLSYVPRQANTLAHKLARKALELDDELVWNGFIPTSPHFM